MPASDPNQQRPRPKDFIGKGKLGLKGGGQKGSAAAEKAGTQAGAVRLGDPQQSKEALAERAKELKAKLLSTRAQTPNASEGAQASAGAGSAPDKAPTPAAAASDDVIVLEDEAEAPSPAPKPSLPQQIPKTDTKVAPPEESSSSAASNAPAVARAAPPAKAVEDAKASRARPPPPERTPAARADAARGGSEVPQPAASHASHDEAMARRQARFGSSADPSTGTNAKSSVVTKRFSNPSLGSTPASSPTAASSTSTPAASNAFAPPPPVQGSSAARSASSDLQPDAPASVPVSSSDGTAGKSRAAQPVRPRGSVAGLPAPAFVAHKPDTLVTAASRSENRSVRPPPPTQVHLPSAAASASVAPAVSSSGSGATRAEESTPQNEVLGNSSAAGQQIQSAASGAAATNADPAERTSAQASVEVAAITAKPVIATSSAPTSQIAAAPRDASSQRPAVATASLQSHTAQTSGAAAKAAERSVFKPLPVPPGTACLKRALDGFKEPARKRPRLSAGEMSEWEAEYKFLLDWLDIRLPDARRYTKPDVALVRCSNEGLASLASWWQQALKD